jgi:hypothetical protein
MESLLAKMRVNWERLEVKIEANNKKFDVP